LDKNTTYTKKLLVQVKFTGNAHPYRTCVNVNGHHWNTRKLVFTRTRTLNSAIVSYRIVSYTATRRYPDSYSY